ncbi:unnamed protein product [Parnassius apollo]|uniref:(apollo) hypothetical protein n=1 Tax=Parnassius apollo TaxID=110799 RepID=A0A8S3XJW8_PARAO|nr:unnamed protein product [Parnassius apollo]
MSKITSEKTLNQSSANMISIVCILIICGLYLLKVYSKSRHEPPLLAGGLPILGHAHLLIGGGLRLWKSVKIISYKCCKAGGISTLLMGPFKFYVLTDPDDFMTVANSCLEKGFLYNFAKPWLGEGLLTAPRK